MNAHDDFAFARRVLAVDALTCTAAGALMTFAAAPLAQMTNLSEVLLRGAGLSLFPVAALFAWMAKTRRLNGALIGAAVAGNAGWVAASFAVLVLTSPTSFGYAFVLVQAIAVAALAVLEARATRAPGRLAAG